MLEAELEPAPLHLIVADLQGSFAHAMAFGEVGEPIEEAWALIEAALDAADSYDVRPIDAPQSPRQDAHSHGGHRGQRRDPRGRAVNGPPLIPEPVSEGGLVGLASAGILEAP
jgi:hypothetical protein